MSGTRSRLQPADRRAESGGARAPAELSASALARRRLGVAGRMAVPLDEPRALDWLVRRHLVPHGRRERLARWLARLPGGSKPGTALLLERRATAGELAGEARWAEALSTVDWLLDGEGRSFLAAGGLPGAAGWVAAADYATTERRRTLVFLFADGSGAPAAVAKVRPRHSSGDSLAREAENLRGIRGELPPGLAATVPAVLARHHDDEREALLLAALPGRSAWAESHGTFRPARAVARHLAATAGWLARFHAATRRSQPFTLPAWEEIGAGEPPPPWYRRLGERLARRPLPLAAGHGDYWPRNVLLSGDEVSAVGAGEAARPAAPPYEDLFAFPWSAVAAFPWRRGRRLAAEDAFAHGFLADNPVSRAVAAYLARYGAAHDLDGTTLHDLFRLWLRTRPAGDDPRGGDIWRTCDRRLGEAGRSVFSG